MTLRLVGQSGSSTYLVYVGDGKFQGKTVKMARVYDRIRATLGEPWPLDAITARGYWDDVSDPPIVQQSIEAEVAQLV